MSALDGAHSLIQINAALKTTDSAAMPFRSLLRRGLMKWAPMEQLRPKGYLVIETHEQLPDSVPELVPLAASAQTYQKGEQRSKSLDRDRAGCPIPSRQPACHPNHYRRF
jgi:hypothetical protein